VIRSKLVAEGADRLQDCDLDLGQVDGPRLEMLSPTYTTCKETTLQSPLQISAAYCYLLCGAAAPSVPSAGRLLIVEACARR
jgi:hypothetical protein